MRTVFWYGNASFHTFSYHLLSKHLLLGAKWSCSLSMNTFSNIVLRIDTMLVGCDSQKVNSQRMLNINHFRHMCIIFSLVIFT